MIRLGLALLVALPALHALSTWEFVDPRTVQSATIYELNAQGASCHSILEGGAVCATAGRHFELKPAERDRAMTLLNERLHYDAKARPSCAVPRQAIVFETTQGKRAMDISLECNNVGGRAPSVATRTALAQFLRSFGFVEHVPLDLSH